MSIISIYVLFASIFSGGGNFRDGVGSGGIVVKMLEKRIEDAIGDVAAAQNIINLAHEENTNLDDVATLLEKKVDAHQIEQWLQDGVKLNGATTLLEQGIVSYVVTQLINNHVNLRDVATNSQILLDGNVRIDLVNAWLKNGTHLKDAIAIINQEIDLNQIGTSSKVEDFTDLIGATPNEVVSRIPTDAKILPWKPDPGRIEQGMKFGWTDPSGQDWEVRMHEADPKALPGSHAASGWVLRVKYGKGYMDTTGTFYSQKALFNPRSPYYNPTAANATHMPIQQP